MVSRGWSELATADPTARGEDTLQFSALTGVRPMSALPIGKGRRCVRPDDQRESAVSSGADRGLVSRDFAPRDVGGYLRVAFSSSAADLRISRDNVSSFTALAIETAPTSAESAAMALARRDFLVRPPTNLVSNSR